MKSEHGEFELDVPRDRNGSFEPEVVKKNQRTMTGEIEEKILALYAHGNSYSQISELIEDIYGVGFSKGAISAVTDKIIPLLQEWKTRPLEEVYPFIFLDAIHFMGIQNASKKWTMPVRNWSLTIYQLAIHFEGRSDKALDLHV